MQRLRPTSVFPSHRYDCFNRRGHLDFLLVQHNGSRRCDHPEHTAHHDVGGSSDDDRAIDM